jgi:nucleoside 2-deoxyribosyltransferase
LPKLFLAGPFKALVSNESSGMSESDISIFMSIIEFFEGRGWEVHCAHRREQWGREFMTPAECTVIDYNEIASSDVLVAFPGVPASPGTHVELGWASAMKKPIVLLMEADGEYAFLVRGLEEITAIKHVKFTGNGPENLEILSAINDLVPELSDAELS